MGMTRRGFLRKVPIIFQYPARRHVKLAKKKGNNYIQNTIPMGYGRGITTLCPDNLQVIIINLHINNKPYYKLISSIRLRFELPF